MQPYQERVIEEVRALDEKIEKLDAFISSPAFRKVWPQEKRMLRDQRTHMRRYSAILHDRIATFKDSERAAFEAAR